MQSIPFRDCDLCSHSLWLTSLSEPPGRFWKSKGKITYIHLGNSKYHHQGKNFGALIKNAVQGGWSGRGSYVEHLSFRKKNKIRTSNWELMQRLCEFKLMCISGPLDSGCPWMGLWEIRVCTLTSRFVCSALEMCFWQCWGGGRLCIWAVA